MNLRDELHFLKYDLKKRNPEQYKKELEEFYKLDLHNAVKENVEWFTYHPGLYKNQRIYMVISIYNFKSKDLSLSQISEMQKRFNSAATGLFGLGADNFADLLLSDTCDHLYKFLLSNSNFTLWDDTGSIHLLTLSIADEYMSVNEIRQIEEVMYDYRNQIIQCCDCNKKIKIHEVAGQFFTGRYCKECWGREWGEKAARETYN